MTLTHQRGMRGKVTTMKIGYQAEVELPNWLAILHTIEGAEEAGSEGTPNVGSQGEPAGSESGSSESSSDDGDDDDRAPEGMPQEDFDKLPEDHPLRKALRAERAANKQAARERKREQRELEQLRQEKEQRELAAKSETDREKILREKAEQRAERLAQGYLRTNLDRAIEKVARDAKFIDVDDALSGVDRTTLAYEQDKDDPSQVTIDEKSIKRAVDALARRKPHLIRQGTEDGQPTGSTFGAGGRGGGKKTSEEQLKEQYPALR